MYSSPHHFCVIGGGYINCEFVNWHVVVLGPKSHLVLFLLPICPTSGYTGALALSWRQWSRCYTEPFLTFFLFAPKTPSERQQLLFFFTRSASLIIQDPFSLFSLHVKFLPDRSEQAQTRLRHGPSLNTWEWTVTVTAQSLFAFVWTQSAKRVVGAFVKCLLQKHF